MAHLQADAHTVDHFLEGPYCHVILEAAGIANRLRPGQFVTADLGDPVRVPLLPTRVSGEQADFLLPVDHPASALKPDSTVNLIGPLGTAIELPRAPTRLLLIADATRLPPLLLLAHRALENGASVALFLNAATAAEIYPPALLPTALEVQVAIGEPSAPASELLLWADRVLVATDPARYPALSEAIQDTRLMPAADFAQALLMPTIVCGVGACHSCGVGTQKGTRQACTDGPFFNLLELEFL